MKREQLWAMIASATSSDNLLALPLTLAIYDVNPTYRHVVRVICKRRTEWNLIEFGEAAHLVRTVPSADIDILITHWHGDDSSAHAAPILLCGELLSDRRAHRRFGPALIATVSGPRFLEVDEVTGKFVLDAEGRRELGCSVDATFCWAIVDVDEWWETVFFALRSAARDPEALVCA